MKYAYFPGCSLHSTAREYDLSTRAVASRLNIELAEVPDWICCGATPAHITMHLLSLALPVNNLLKAKRTGAREVAVCCAACFSRLKIANDRMANGSEPRAHVTEIVGEEYRGELRVRHFLEIITNVVGMKTISELAVKKLMGLKVACYYGCLLARPPEVMQFDDVEDPHLMDDLMKAIGAEPVNWPYKTECCGASFSLARTDVVLKLSRDILQMARDAGAEAIVVACPLCQLNLDLRQAAINKKYKQDFHLPVFYFTQLLGFGLGIDPKKLGFNRLMVNPAKLLRAVAGRSCA